MSLEALKAAIAAMEGGRPAALCTVVGVDGSAPRSTTARMVVYGDEATVGTVGGGSFEHRVIAEALQALNDGRPRRFRAHLTRDLGMCCGGAMDVLIEPLEGVPRLHCFGGGHVARPTVALARELGFEVSVYDERDEWLTPERFPGCRLVPGNPRRQLPTTGPLDYLLIVTHEHALDQDLLEALLPGHYAWLGMIGSRTKVAKFFLRLRAGGVDEALFRRVSAPVGLDIGAETPEEIAVSIAAELVRVRRGHRGPTPAMSEHPLPARGGDGTALPPALEQAPLEPRPRPPRS